MVQTSPPVSRAGKIGGDLQIMGMSSAEETESGASAALHLQHLHIFVEFGTGENLQGYIVRTPRSCLLCSGHPRSQLFSLLVHTAQDETEGGRELIERSLSRSAMKVTDPSRA